MVGYSFIVFKYRQNTLHFNINENETYNLDKKQDFQVILTVYFSMGLTISPSNSDQTLKNTL